MKGWKTWLGTIGWVVCEGTKSILPEHAATFALMQTLFVGLGVVGIGHKLDRAQSSQRRLTD